MCANHEPAHRVLADATGGRAVSRVRGLDVLGSAAVVARVNAPTVECQDVKCHCGQLLAHRYGVVIVPIGATVKRERDGRVRLQCPSCGARVTVVDDRRAA